jgi:FkbM family methyltransferase
VIAVEPDESNYSLLEQNCRPYGKRAILLRAAVWSRDDEVLEIVGSEEACGISVAPGTTATAVACPSISMTSLLRLIPDQRADILKCDIEGAELQLFGEGVQEWLPLVRYIAIELHTPECHRAVFSATAPFGFSCQRYRNIYFLQR